MNRRVLLVALLGVLLVLGTALLLPQAVEQARPEPVDLTLDAVEVFEDLPTTHPDEDVD